MSGGMDEDEEAALRAISDAEEELRTQEAHGVYYPPDDMSIPEVFITRIMERLMMTREEASEKVLEVLNSSREEVRCYLLHDIAEREGATAAAA